MDYPLDWRQMLTTVLSIDKILKFSRILILEFSDSPTQILVVFLSRKTVGRATRTEYFSDDRLSNSCFGYSLTPIMSKLFFVQCRRYWRSSKFLLREYAFIWNRERDLFLLGIPTCILSIIIIFRKRNIFRFIIIFYGCIVKLIY